MDDTFKIFVHRIKDEHEERITETLSPDFLGIQESELAFKSPVILNGIAEVADDTLVLRLSVETEATMPCALCNRDAQVKILIPDFCHTEALSEIKNGVFDYQETLREEILLAVPYTAECNNGDCPERAGMAKYLTKNIDLFDSSGRVSVWPEGSDDLLSFERNGAEEVNEHENIGENHGSTT